MNESIVVIRTFDELLSADEAQVELLTAGIHSLLLSGEGPTAIVAAEPRSGIALAVHGRDVELAEAVLAPKPRMT